METTPHSPVTVLTEFWCLLAMRCTRLSLEGGGKDQRQTLLHISICVSRDGGGDGSACPPWLPCPTLQSQRPQSRIRFLLAQCGSNHPHPSSCPMSWQRSAEQQWSLVKPDKVMMVVKESFPMNDTFSYPVLLCSPSVIPLFSPPVQNQINISLLVRDFRTVYHVLLWWKSTPDNVCTRASLHPCLQNQSQRSELFSQGRIFVPTFQPGHAFLPTRWNSPSAISF